MDEEFFERNALAYWHEKRSFTAIETTEISEFIDSSIEMSGRLLDVGCGPGDDLGRLNQRRHSKLYGIDPSAAFIKIAQNQLGPGVRISKGVCENLPYVDGYFSTIVSRFSLHHCDDIDQAVSEVCRCLQSNGVFICIIPHPTFYERNVDSSDTDLVRVTPFDGAVTFTYSKRTLTDFFTDQFLTTFRLLKIREFSLETDKNLLSALGLVARKVVT